VEVEAAEEDVGSRQVLSRFFERKGVEVRSVEVEVGSEYRAGAVRVSEAGEADGDGWLRVSDIPSYI
jgi:hypothetical protein